MNTDLQVTNIAYTVSYSTNFSSNQVYKTLDFHNTSIPQKISVQFQKGQKFKTSLKKKNLFRAVTFFK